MPAFSLVQGGPLHRLMLRLRIARPARLDGSGDTLWTAVAFVVLTWCPLALVAIVQWLVTGRVPTLIVDFGVHARLLIAIPLFFVAERSLHLRTRRCVDLLVSGRWAEEGEPVVARATAAAERLRDATWPEAIILGLAVLGSQAVFWGLAAPLGLMRGRAIDQWTVLEWWYGLVALPIFQFLIGRWLWRWSIWCQLLWRLSRLRLRPVATHPDLSGGLGFLSEPAAGLAYVLMGFSAVQAGIWADQIVFGKASVMSYRMELGVFVLSAVVIALGPLLMFTRQLWRCRFAAMRQYHELATDYTRLFHERWIEQGERSGLLGTPDIQSLADLANSYDILRRMRLVPFGLRDIIVLAATVVVPMIPLVLLQIPLGELLRKVGAVAFGGAP